MRSDHWERLGIAPTDDRRAVKRAYAAVLKTIDVQADPDAFIRLREAMETALAWGTNSPFWEEEEAEDSWPEELPEDEAAEHPVEYWEDLPLPVTFHFNPQPMRVRVGSDALEARCAALEEALFGEGEPDPGRVRALGEEILTDPALASVDCLVGVEQRLAHAIASTIPRSDPLLEPAWARFGWRDTGRGWKRDWAIDQIIGRRNDLAFLAQCGAPHDQHRVALTELRGPARQRLNPFRTELAGRVRAFLKVVDAEHPTVAHDLDPESLAWWRDYLERSRLPANFWPTIIGVPVLLTFGLMLLVAMKEGSGPSMLISYPLFLAGTFGAMLLDVRLRARARRRMATDAGRASNLWPLGIALALPVAAALLPDRTWAALLAAAAAAACLAIVLTRLWIARPCRPGESRYTLPLLAAALSIAIMIEVPLSQGLRLLVPLAAMCWIGIECAATVELRLLGAPIVARRIAAAALALVAASGLLFLLYALSHAEFPLWLLALAPVAVIAGQLGAPSLATTRWPQLLIRLAWFAALIAWNLGAGGFDWIYVAGSLLALLCAGLRCAGALRVGWR